MSERQLPGEDFESRDTLERKLAEVTEAFELFSSPNDEDQRRLVEEVLPHLSEVLGIMLDASQNTWEFLAGEQDQLQRRLNLSE